MALSDAKVRNAKPKQKPYKIYDGDGLFLLVKPSGGKYWRLKYEFVGEKLLACGVYPEISLGEAREKALQARKTLAKGKDPAAERKEAKLQAKQQQSDLFEPIAREWLEINRTRIKDGTYRLKLRRLENHAFPEIGGKPITQLKAADMLQMLRVIEGKGILDTVHRVKQDCDSIFRFAIATSRTENNPIPNLDGALKTPDVKHRSHLKETELPEFFNELAGYDTKYKGKLLTKLALRLIIPTLLRSNELAGGRWEEISFEKKQWVIPPNRMKMKHAHIVPLAKQVLAGLEELQKLTGAGEYMFPNEHNPTTYMSENTMLFALYRMGYRSRATVHGFRSTGSTVLNEAGFRREVIEMQLAHTERDQVRAAYNHAEYLPERITMMQWWSDRLDSLGLKNVNCQVSAKNHLPNS